MTKPVRSRNILTDDEIHDYFEDFPNICPKTAERFWTGQDVAEAISRAKMVRALQGSVRFYMEPDFEDEVVLFRLRWG